VETPAEWQPTFEGLTLPSGPTTPLEVAARATLAAMDAEGLLKGRHAVTAQLVLDLARVIGDGVRLGKTAAVALAARQLLDAVASLPSGDDKPDDAFDRLLKELEEAQG
jgi:hypothetical protein